MAHYDVNVAALSETRLSDEASLTEDHGGYTFYWNGYPTQERRIHGVGFAVKNSLVRLIHDMPNGFSARLMKMRVPLSRDRRCILRAAGCGAAAYTNLRQDNTTGRL
ncbi:hypothetical protein Pmani_003933 [Petrolisthes manimaculis]|uniref:Uncharacterized protein n=1 Tax=Petrolisthes manimaculis TaxID=1843537 RepID=A0AAE1QHU7_9EUCA|nr:hypothetical protein Pmani_003933 [Petrolisthes manimaculis]